MIIWYKTASKPSIDLQQLEKKSNEHDWDSAFAKAETSLPLEREMLSGAVEGRFLKMLVALSGAKRVLEIGSFTGYASLAMAEALPTDDKLIACEYDSYTADFARDLVDKSPHGQKIDIRKGDAMDTLQELAKAGKSFDFIFIDADKKGYTAYYKFIMDHDILNRGGLICVDNTLFMGQAYDAKSRTENGQAIADFNAMIANDERVDTVLIPLRDGVTLIRHRG